MDDAPLYVSLGIPYATQPVGDLRWTAPVDPPPWEDPLPGRTYGPPCSQWDGDGVTSDPSNPPEPELIGAEDCLTLNVWRPANDAAAPRPVMVWIHGGGNTSGSASDALYDASNIAASGDVVVFSVEYRLGPFGYLWHSSLRTGDPLGDSGSFGTLDLQQALRWIGRNAAAFGGDPDNVTIFGESAGAVNTFSLMLSNLGGDAFHRAIAQSGGPSFSTIPDAEAIADNLISRLLIADGLAETEEEALLYAEAQGDVWLKDYLYSKDNFEILSVYETTTGGLLDQAFGPIADGYLFEEDVIADALAGRMRNYPLMVGANRDEIKLFIPYLSEMSSAQFTVLMNAAYGDAASDIIDLYPRSAYDPPTPYNQFADIHDVALELAGPLQSAETYALYQEEVWLYYFTYDAIYPPYDYIYGAAHGFELPFVFGHQTGIYPPITSNAWDTLARETMAHWACFAHQGAPDACDDTPEWPQYKVEGEGARLRKILENPTSIEAVPEIDLVRLQFWLDFSREQDGRLPQVPMSR